MGALVGATDWRNHFVVGIFGTSLAFTVLGSYYAMILIHECGHMIVAQRRGCAVWSIELYPIWGITRFSEPYSRFDHCIIAWAGVATQIIVAAPLVIFFEVLGSTRFQPVNAAVAIFGFLSVIVAAINLIPTAPLDGAIVWGLLPELFKHRAKRTVKREPGWR